MGQQLKQSTILTSTLIIHILQLVFTQIKIKMNFSLILTLMSIAIVDSINPSAIVMTLVQLNGTKKVIPNSLAYILGIFCTYYTLGIVLIYLYNTVGSSFKVDFSPIASFFVKPPNWAYWSQLVIGIATIVYAMIFYKRIDNNSTNNIKTAKTSFLSSFILGIIITGVEAGTAIPYFGAISALYIANLGMLQSIILLFFYNLIFILPPLTIVGLFVLFRSKFQTVIDSINQFTTRYSYPTLKYGMTIVGLILVVDSIVRF
jgi:cytochrome c biogenesis protein CcdA